MYLGTIVYLIQVHRDEALLFQYFASLLLTPRLELQCKGSKLQTLPNRYVLIQVVLQQYIVEDCVEHIDILVKSRVVKRELNQGLEDIV